MDEYGSGGDTSPLLKGFSSSSSSSPSSSRTYGGFGSHGNNEIRVLEVKFLLLTAALLVLMALGFSLFLTFLRLILLIFSVMSVFTGGVLFIVVILTDHGQYDPVTPPNYKVDIQYDYVMVPVDNNQEQISIVIARPKPTNSFLSSVYPGLRNTPRFLFNDLEPLKLILFKYFSIFIFL